MVSGFISRLVILIFGTLYPAYASYKAVRTKNVKEYVKWMMYWIVFALFTCAETFTDLFLSFWFPFYYEIKIITVIYLLSPATKGSSILYRKFVHPVLIKREQEIDEYIAKAKEQGYHTMLNLGSKGVNYATSLIMQTAIKGSGGLMNQLRKSYSLSDLREEENGSVTDGGGSRLIRRNEAQNSGQILPENEGGYYSPEADFYQQFVDANRKMLFPNDMNSGYSSGGDPLYFNMRSSKGEGLVRTASLGPSSRYRTRAVTKNGLPKRASLSEGGSTRSALEPQESQNETDNFSFPLSHSTSYPSPLASFPPYFVPEYQQMFNNVIHNQMFAFITQPQSYSQVLDDSKVAFQNAFEGGLECQSDGTSGNHSVYISEENSVNSSEVNSKGDAPDVTGEVQIDNTENSTANPATGENKEEENLTETKAVEEKETTKEHLFPSPGDGLDAQEKQFQKRSGKYKKKPAPTPPTEQPVSKSTSNLTAEDEESQFFTPNASPKPSRKQSLSSLDFPPDKSNADSDGKSKTQASATAETPKKAKPKKGDVNISKRLNIPKMSFSFWHQKPGKHSSNSDSCSVASVESASTKSETQSDLEFFIPLKDTDENKDEESNGKPDPLAVKSELASDQVLS